MRLDSNSNFSETLQSFKLYLLLTHLKKPHHTIISHPLHGLSTKTKKARYPSEPFCLRCIFYFHTTSPFSLIFNHFSVLRCRLHHKDTNFKANHNAFAYDTPPFADVDCTTNIRILNKSQIDGMMKRFKNITWFKLLDIYPFT